MYKYYWIILIPYLNDCYFLCFVLLLFLCCTLKPAKQEVKDRQGERVQFSHRWWSPPTRSHPNNNTGVCRHKFLRPKAPEGHMGKTLPQWLWRNSAMAPWSRDCISKVERRRHLGHYRQYCDADHLQSRTGLAET